ncbi:MAG: membrane protein insertion efficiency factor YidD [Candidatus Pacebacteria bacterium]|nr:membrane protein insertion efficiency factor YidD [Candidatus Paceibacterota bacterium]
MVLVLIWIYQHCISPWKPACCRFQPTCSAYARDAIRHFGIIHGGYLAFRRIVRCHPFYRGPLYDPVPSPQASNAPEASLMVNDREKTVSHAD